MKLRFKGSILLVADVSFRFWQSTGWFSWVRLKEYKHQHVQWEHAFLIIELFKITSTQVLFNASNSAKTQFMLERPSFLLQFDD